MPPGDGRRAGRSALRAYVALALTLALLAVAAIDLSGLIPLSNSGPVGLVGLFSAHLTLAALVVAIPIVILARTRPLQVAIVVLLVAGFIRFGDEWWSPPSAAPNGPTLDAVTWNLEIGSRSAEESIAFLRQIDADVVGLEELTPDVAAAIGGDPVLRSRYPHQALYGSNDVLGLGLLSAGPQSQVTFVDGPSRLEAVVATYAGPVRVLVVHPLPARIPVGPLGAPVGFEPAIRDGALGRIGTSIEQALAGPEPLVVLGDINTASTEPEFGRFTKGLHDAHAEVGLGPGWTYRPSRLEFLGFGLIRIDVVLAGPGFRPTAETTRCPMRGDHCAVLATLARD